MFTFRDLLPGDCWRFPEGDEDAPDHDPTFCFDQDAGEKAPSIPRGWDSWGLERNDKSAFYEDHKDRPVELLEHYTTHPKPRLLALKRRGLTAGDCFQYLDDGDDNRSLGVSHIVDGPNVSLRGLPREWCVSTNSAKYRMDSPVRRIWRWDNARPVETRVLPCIDPAQDLRIQLKERLIAFVEGVRGADCLTRFEEGQRTESIAWTGAGYVCTNAACGLTATQLEHARITWTMAVRLRVDDKAAEEAERERTRIVCDPNYVE